MESVLVVAIILIILGVIGSIIPVLPGPIFSFVAIILIAASESVAPVSFWTMGFFSLAMLMLILLDYLAPILGAKFAGASGGSLLWAISGAFLGIILFPPIGIFIGAFAGAIIGEMQGGKDFQQAARAGFGVVVGSVMSMVFQLTYSLIVALYFLIKIF